MDGEMTLRYYIKARLTLVVSAPEVSEEEAREIVKATILNAIENDDLVFTVDSGGVLIGGVLHDYGVTVGSRFEEKDF